MQDNPNARDSTPGTVRYKPTPHPELPLERGPVLFPPDVLKCKDFKLSDLRLKSKDSIWTKLHIKHSLSMTSQKRKPRHLRYWPWCFYVTSRDYFVWGCCSKLGEIILLNKLDCFPRGKSQSPTGKLGDYFGCKYKELNTPQSKNPQICSQ